MSFFEDILEWNFDKKRTIMASSYRFPKITESKEYKRFRSTIAKKKVMQTLAAVLCYVSSKVTCWFRFRPKTT